MSLTTSLEMANSCFKAKTEKLTIQRRRRLPFFKKGKMKIGKREIVEKSLKLFSGVAKVSKRQLPLVLLLMHLCHPLNIFLHSGISCVKQLMTVCHELKQDFFDPSFEMINGLVPLRY